MIDESRLLNQFLDLARISSPSGGEGPVADAIAAVLTALGMAVERDAAGNLLSRLDGVGEPLLLTAHMDTVGPCENVTPVVRDGVVYSDGTTILGADDKAGVAVILEVLRCLTEGEDAHRPVDVLFTVREEVGLEGAKAFDTSQLRARMGIGLDHGGEQGTVVVSAPSQNALQATVHGKMAHAGANPELGLNAIRVAAEAIAAMPLGRIDEETTANIGIIAGGTATNIVPDRVEIQGEARSRSEAKLQTQTEAMVRALEERAQANGARVDIEVTRQYDPYRLGAEDPVVALVTGAMRSVGIEPIMVATGGGSDANVFNAAGVATVQISCGMAEVHTCEEHVALADMVSTARIVLACLRPGA
ncbi:MAG TPA: M20/M25/M40 family metallo-hydrolase [Chloroflexi bacterium]|jgi:tripeptide aminopeptidase|nr:M20/M25/M40 family metallo-hydrolase [Chloroflexota bacterium]